MPTAPLRNLITGGAGFLGSNLASSFLKKSDEVFILDNLEREGSQKNLDWLEKQDFKKKLKF